MIWRVHVGLERLPAAVGRGRLRRHQRAQAAPGQGLEARHRALQQVSIGVTALDDLEHVGNILLSPPQRRRQLRGPVQEQRAHLPRRRGAVGAPGHLPGEWVWW